MDKLIIGRYIPGNSMIHRLIHAVSYSRCLPLSSSSFWQMMQLATAS